MLKQNSNYIFISHGNNLVLMKDKAIAGILHEKLVLDVLSGWNNYLIYLNN